jgi:comEA protein
MSNNKYKVLIIEDEQNINNLLDTLMQANGYQTIIATSCGSGLMMYASHRPDIVILDLGLPDKDGVEIIQKIRSWSNMPIIVISARTEDSDKIGALDAGADDYLTKPFSVDELLARLRVTQRRLALIKADTAQDVQGVGKVNINTADKTALMTLPGIGASKAEDIIQYRKENGSFQKIEDIKKISGIKDVAFNKIKELICV